MFLKASQCNMHYPFAMSSYDVEHTRMEKCTDSSEMHESIHLMVEASFYFQHSNVLYIFLLIQLNRTVVGMVVTPLFLTAPLQPWQTLTLLSQRLTKVIRASLQVTSRIAFMRFFRGLIFRKKLFLVL